MAGLLVSSLAYSIFPIHGPKYVTLALLGYIRN